MLTLLKLDSRAEMSSLSLTPLLLVAYSSESVPLPSSSSVETWCTLSILAKATSQRDVALLTHELSNPLGRFLDSSSCCSGAVRVILAHETKPDIDSVFDVYGAPLFRDVTGTEADESKGSFPEISVATRAEFITADRAARGDDAFTLDRLVTGGNIGQIFFKLCLFPVGIDIYSILCFYVVSERCWRYFVRGILFYIML